MFIPLQTSGATPGVIAQTITLDYAQYQQSRWLDFPHLKQIDLVGNLREVNIMKKWLTKHFPEITLIETVEPAAMPDFSHSSMFTQAHINLDYAAYQQSHKHDYAQVSSIELVGNEREVGIMKRWLERHFPNIAITQPDFGAEQMHRAQIEQVGIAKLSPFDKFRYEEFWRIARALSDVVGFNNLFDVDHANSIAEFGELAIHPDNLQLMMFRVNRSKHMKSQPRYSWARQQQVIWSSIDTVGELMLSQQQIVEALIMQLAAVYSEQVDLDLAL